MNRSTNIPEALASFLELTTTQIPAPCLTIDERSRLDELQAGYDKLNALSARYHHGTVEIRPGLFVQGGPADAKRRFAKELNWDPESIEDSSRRLSTFEDEAKIALKAVNDGRWKLRAEAVRLLRPAYLRALQEFDSLLGRLAAINLRDLYLDATPLRDRIQIVRSEYEQWLGILGKDTTTLCPTDLAKPFLCDRASTQQPDVVASGAGGRVQLADAAAQPKPPPADHGALIEIDDD
jgi:hypothetical protein